MSTLDEYSFRKALEGSLAAPFTSMAADEAGALAEKHYGLRGKLTRFSTEKDDTFRVDSPDGRRHVLKVANPAETELEIAFQCDVLRHVAAKDPGLPVPQVVASKAGFTHFAVHDRAGQERRLRLMTFLEGTVLDSTESNAGERAAVGEVLGRLRNAMSDFSHPGDSPLIAWDIKHLPALAYLADGVEDSRQRDMLARGLERYRSIAGQIARLPAQVLHNDFSRSNIVVDHDHPKFVTGVIDFGDTVRTAVAIDVSTALLNQLLRRPDIQADTDIFADARDLLRGYLRVAELSEEELQLLPHLTMGRVIARALITLWRARLFPENATYILRNTAPGWRQLEWFLSRPFETVSGTFLSKDLGMSPPSPRPRGKMVNAFDPSQLDRLNPSTRAAVEKRARVLGPAYRLFYQNPVEVCRGEGVHLYDSDGNAYLDAYNNVVAVGHCHPTVAEAVAQQMRTLCTHTRYIQSGILKYAEELLSTFGGRIGKAGHAMFTCTGSEANDLAMRIARHHTGRKGIIITSEAYHGNSHLTAGFSPSLGERSRLGTWVRRVPTPDSYRIPAAGMGAWFADRVAEQIADLERRGEGLAAFIADSLFSSDGIFAHPTDLLGPAAEVVRKAGGLFVADEVQSGFARTGDKFWGYQRHRVDPDIVTMGKPMGNGFPVAGIAVAADAVARFGNDMRYFNTFGGNGVAIAAAQATFDVIRQEDLQANAHKIGKLLQEGLNALAQRHARIGDVRGAGLYVGVELVRDRGTKEPDAAAATAVVNGLRERRVLISATGFHANVLKIRPPLVFSESNAEHLLRELDATLAAL